MWGLTFRITGRRRPKAGANPTAQPLGGPVDAVVMPRREDGRRQVRQGLIATCRVRQPKCGWSRLSRREAGRPTVRGPRLKPAGALRPLASRRLFSQVALDLLALFLGHGREFAIRHALGALDPLLLIDAPVGHGSVAVVGGLVHGASFRLEDSGQSLIREISLDIIIKYVKTYFSEISDGSSTRHNMVSTPEVGSNSPASR